MESVMGQMGFRFSSVQYRQNIAGILCLGRRLDWAGFLAGGSTHGPGGSTTGWQNVRVENAPKV